MRALSKAQAEEEKDGDGAGVGVIHQRHVLHPDNMSHLHTRAQRHAAFRRGRFFRAAKSEGDQADGGGGGGTSGSGPHSFQGIFSSLDNTVGGMIEAAQVSCVLWARMSQRRCALPQGHTQSAVVFTLPVVSEVGLTNTSSLPGIDRLDQVAGQES